MKSKEGSYIYEIVNLQGEPITAPYGSEKSLNESLKIAQRFDPLYHEKHRVKVMRVMPVGFESIEAPKVELEGLSNVELCDLADAADSKAYFHFCETGHDTSEERDRELLISIINGEYEYDPPCEDCDSLDHVEGSEFCEVSYPEDKVANDAQFANWAGDRLCKVNYAHCAKCRNTNTGKPLDDGTFECEVCKAIIVVDKSYYPTEVVDA